MSRTTPPSEHDFAAIEAAVMETERGRWFLAEHAARHRVADTEAILAAIGRMGAAAPALPAHLDGGLRDIGAILAAARAAARGNAPDSSPPHLRPMQVADGAITAVRRVAEKIHEVAFELRETARVPRYADALDLYCRDLDSAALLQEKAIVQLAELAGVVDAIEEKLASLVAALPPRTEPEAAAMAPAPGAAPLPSVASLPLVTPMPPAAPVPGGAPQHAPANADAAPAAMPTATETLSIEPATKAAEASVPASAPQAREPPRRTLLLVQPVGPKR